MPEPDRDLPRAEVVRRPRPLPTPRASAEQAIEVARAELDLVRAAPGVARVAAVSTWHLLSWSAGAMNAGANYIARRAMAGEPATEIVQDAAVDMRAAAWRALGLQTQRDTDPAGVPDRLARTDASVAELRRRGANLMHRAGDVHDSEQTHPAFSRILGEITPDEARILRFLYLEGPQPSIDVRTNRPLGIGSQLVAGGLTMIAEHAGCRFVDRISPYLTNLARLGLIQFSKEQVRNPQRYQVIEAQPKVVDALRRAGRMPRMVQRSIHLNAFGEQFCRTCLPVGPTVTFDAGLDAVEDGGPRRPRPRPS